MGAFTGFPDEALQFFEGLEADNSKAYWTDHKPVYDTQVRAPMEALAAAVEPEFGAATLFRPYRDVRFAKDKSPYKTQIAMVVNRGGAGFYVQLTAAGLMVGGGTHSTTSDQIARYRAAVSEDRTGDELAAVVADLERRGFAIEGDQLKTRPRGVPEDHPRLRLLRFRSVYGMRAYEPQQWLHTGEALDRVVADWRELRPLVEWLGRTVGPPAERG